MVNRMCCGILVSLLVICFVPGCSNKMVAGVFRPSGITFHLTADQVINDGVLLPVDIILVSESRTGPILEIGPEGWFGHSGRDGLLEGELCSLAVSGGESREKKVKLAPEVKRIIIFADYDNNSERAAQQLVITPGKWKRNYRVKIRGDELELEK